METTGVAETDTFTALYDRYAATILRYCTRRVGPDVAEDVVAATFLVAYERWQAYDQTAEALPWLYGIATNLLRRHRRSEARAYRALARTGIDPVSNAAGVVESHEHRAGERADASARSRATGYEHEQWAEPDGMIVVAIQRTDNGQVSLAADEAAMQQEVANQRARFATEGPSIALPTRQYLAGLTTDPVALRQKLKAGLGSKRDDVVIKDATDWLYRVDPVLTPRIRTALVQALDTLPGVRVDHSARTLGGRSVYLVEQRNSRGTDGLIVDTATGRFVGSYAAGGDIDPWSTATRWDFAVVNR